MVQISEDLIRKRAEHNECIISTLEEISLHQQDIERIEYIDKWCRDLKILYLQSNLIPKIENVGRLKKLEYINLALNNIERVENLEGCESLQKLDLTVNFVGELTSVESLRNLRHLREIYLTGNPCTEYVGYRTYVVAALPQLKTLDGVEVEKSERILAVQSFTETRNGILQQQAVYRRKREKQKAEEEGDKTAAKDDQWYTDINTDRDGKRKDTEDGDDKTEEEKEKEFWEEKVAFTPESRIKVHQHMEAVKKRDEQKTNEQEAPKLQRRLQDENGRIFNVNEAKVQFELTENDANVLLDVSIFKHMETSLCDVDIQPTYVKVTIKGKVLQLVLPEEVRPDSSSAKRSQITGHLLITMPKLNPILSPSKPAMGSTQEKPIEKRITEQNGRQKLEVDPSLARTVDLSIVADETAAPKIPLLGNSLARRDIPERANSDDFMDDPDVPPLM